MNRMNIEGVRDGYVRLSSPNGIIDTRNGDVFTEVIVKKKSAKWFKEVEDKEAKLGETDYFAAKLAEGAATTKEYAGVLEKRQ